MKRKQRASFFFAACLMAEKPKSTRLSARIASFFHNSLWLHEGQMKVIIRRQMQSFQLHLKSNSNLPLHLVAVVELLIISHDLNQQCLPCCHGIVEISIFHFPNDASVSDFPKVPNMVYNNTNWWKRLYNVRERVMETAEHFEPWHVTLCSDVLPSLSELWKIGLHTAALSSRETNTPTCPSFCDLICAYILVLYWVFFTSCQTQHRLVFELVIHGLQTYYKSSLHPKSLRNVLMF